MKANTQGTKRGKGKRKTRDRQKVMFESEWEAEKKKKGEEKRGEKAQGCMRRETQTDSQMKGRLKCRWETRENSKWWGGET